MSDNAKKTFSAIRNSAIIKNPVLFEAVGIAPVVAMAVSLKSAIILSVVAAVELVVIEIIACLLFKKINSCFRVLFYAVLGVLINVPFYMFFTRFAPNETAYAGIFLPLIAVNSLVALHCERFAVRNKIKATMVDAVSSAAGYVFIIIITGTIREIFGSGTIYSVDLQLPVKLPGFIMPFGGFLVLGFLAAFFKWVISKRYPDEKPEAAFNLSEISESHIDNIRNLLDDDFNPYDEVSTQEPESFVIGNVIGKAEKLKGKKPKIKANKPEKAKKPKKEKAVKPEKADAHIEKTADKTRESKPVSERRREYVSEFDDLLSDITKKDEPDDKNSKGGDEQ